MPSKENKIIIKQFKDSSSNWFVNFAHYHLNQNNEIEWSAGETDKEELREALQSYIKRNKKVYKSREESIFEQQQVEYLTLTFGKFAGKKLDEIRDIEPSYLKWLVKTTSDERIKEQLKILLKK